MLMAAALGIFADYGACDDDKARTYLLASRTHPYVLEGVELGSTRRQLGTELGLMKLLHARTRLGPV